MKRFYLFILLLMPLIFASQAHARHHRLNYLPSKAFYTIQLFSARHFETLQSYVKVHGMRSKAYYMKINVNGKTWYRLLYGHYNDRFLALRDKAQLSKKLVHIRPIVKPIENAHVVARVFRQKRRVRHTRRSKRHQVRRYSHKKQGHIPRRASKAHPVMGHRLAKRKIDIGVDSVSTNLHYTVDDELAATRQLLG